MTHRILLAAAICLPVMFALWIFGQWHWEHMRRRDSKKGGEL